MAEQRSLSTMIAAGLGSVTRFKAGSALVGGRGVHGLFGPIRESFAGAWQKGVTVDPLGSLASYSPIYACVTRISSDIAKLGIQLLVEQTEGGILEKAPKTSPYWQVLRKPNPFQNRIQFIRGWLLSKLLFGNTYVLKVRDFRTIVTRLYLLDPRRVTPLVTPEGDVYYSLGGDDLARIPAGMVVPASEIIHDRAPTLWHPLVGVPPIYACALSGTLGLRIQQNSTAFFENMSRPSGMLSAPGTIDETTAERLKREWNTMYSGANLGKVAIAGDGLEYHAMTIAAEASQLVEQLGLTAVDVATAFSMPAYKINQGQMPTNNNVQALDQQYYSACLQVQIEDIELCLSEGLAVPSGYSVEFDLDGLLRMDSATQMDVLAKGVGGAILKPNEARLRLNLKPVAGGDTVYLQQQNYSVAALDKRDGREDPFAAAKPPAPSPAPAAEPAPAPAPAAAADGATREALGLAAKAADAERQAVAKSEAAAAALALSEQQLAAARAEIAGLEAVANAAAQAEQARAASEAQAVEFFDTITKALDAEPA